MPPTATGRSDAPTSTTSDGRPGAESAGRMGRFARRRPLSGVSIQSKLLVMLLVTSILSAAVVGAIGFQSGRTSLRASVFDGLTEIRGSQSRQLEAQFKELENALVTFTRGATTTEAIEAYTAAFSQLNTSTMRAGIDTGTVTSGLVGRTTLAYDMWGSAVNLAYRVQSGSPQPGVYVTSAVYDVMRDSRDFSSAGAITVDGEEQSIWRLTDRQS